MYFTTAAPSFAQQTELYILFRYANILILYRHIFKILCISAHKFRTRPSGSWARTRENVNVAIRSEDATGMDFDLAEMTVNG